MPPPPQQPPPPSPDEASAISSGARLAIAASGFCRVVSFGLNLALARSVSPELLGLASVQLQLLLATSLFLGREGFRLALVRPTASPQQHVNAAFLAAPCGLVLAAGAARVGWSAVPAAHRPAALLYCLGAAVESLNEPLYLVAEARLLLGLRARAEAVAAVARAVCTYVCVAVLGCGATGFGLGCVAYAACLLPQYAFGLARSPGGLPRPRLAAGVDAAQLALVGTFAAHGVFKHVLTEGDKIVLTFGAGLYHAGVYALVHNYGSLVVRLVLKPLEDAARLRFARLHARGGAGAGAALRAAVASRVRGAALLGAVLVSFGAPHAATLLWLLSGARWAGTDAPAALAWYCVYAAVLAVNGILEAAVAAVMQRDESAALAGAHAACFCLFAALARPLMARFGATGLIAASAAATLPRIAFCARCLHARFADLGVADDARGGGAMGLDPRATAVLAAAAAAALASDAARAASGGEVWAAHLCHVARGAALLAAAGYGVWRFDRPLCAELLAAAAGKAKKA